MYALHGKHSQGGGTSPCKVFCHSPYVDLYNLQLSVDAYRYSDVQETPLDNRKDILASDFAPVILAVSARYPAVNFLNGEDVSVV